MIKYDYKYLILVLILMFNLYQDIYDYIVKNL
jgi:hypothetical protein